MSESINNRVTLKQGFDAPMTLIASRPGVLPLLKHAGDSNDGMYFNFHGTIEQLIAAGVATDDMFANMNVSGQRKRDDGYGGAHTVTRRGGKQWELVYQLNAEGDDRIPSDHAIQDKRETKWWAEHGASARAVTAEILERFARPPARS